METNDYHAEPAENPASPKTRNPGDPRKSLNRKISNSNMMNSMTGSSGSLLTLTISGNVLTGA